MWLISLLFLPLSSALLTIPYGIQYKNMAEDWLGSQGCSLCFDALYEEAAYSEDILSCAGPVLFVGAKDERMLRMDCAGYDGPYYWSQQFILGAFGLASEIHKFTVLNTPHESNGVYWYFTPGKSFGFLSDSDLHQATADIGYTNPYTRLSWNLSKYGGYRLGISIPSDDEYSFRKRIYSCPLMII